MFEPGGWQAAPTKAVPVEVPSLSRDCFGTPAGLLINELQHAPELIVASLIELGRNALDLDMGRFRREGSSLALLYALRLFVRVDSHVAQILASSGSNSVGAGAKTRGTEASEAAASSLPRLHRKLKTFLWDRFFPVVERWANRALRERDSSSACVLQAHLAFLTKNSPRASLDYRQVSTLLVAQTYLANFYAWDVDATPAPIQPSRGSSKGRAAGEALKMANVELQIPQTELLAIFQVHAPACGSLWGGVSKRRADTQILSPDHERLWITRNSAVPNATLARAAHLAQGTHHSATHPTPLPSARRIGAA